MHNKLTVNKLLTMDQLPIGAKVYTKLRKGDFFVLEGRFPLKCTGKRCFLHTESCIDKSHSESDTHYVFRYEDGDVYIVSINGGWRNHLFELYKDGYFHDIDLHEPIPCVDNK